MTKPTPDRIAETFKQLLIKKNINAYRIAKETGIDKTYLSKLSSGAIAKPGQDKLIRIAEALNIASEQLQLVFADPNLAIKTLALDNISSTLEPATKPQQDWGAAPDGIICYDRQAEFDTVREWIEVKRSRIVTIYGLGGIGKTTLAMKLAKQLESEFEYVFWRNLNNVPLSEILIQDALGLFKARSSRATISQQITTLLQYLRDRRCLLVFDRLETILASGNSIHCYENGYRIYEELLRQIAQTQHQSCLLLISNEKPRYLAVRESDSALIHSLKLKGSTRVCHRILQDKAIPPSSACEDLIDIYRAHPLAIEIVATTILELFNGDVSEFLRQNTLFLGDLQFIIHQQYERLGDIEKSVLCTIAEADKPLSLPELTALYTTRLRCSQIINCLERLHRRSLLEISQGDLQNLYGIQPVVRKYIQSTG